MICHMRFAFFQFCNKHDFVVVIWGGERVKSTSVLIVFSQMCFLYDFFEKTKGRKRTWANPMGSKQWKSQFEIGNFTFLCLYAFFVFWKRMKTDDFWGRFGVTILVKTVILVKYQGWGWGIENIWSGRFGWGLVMVLVISKVALWRQQGRLMRILWTPRSTVGVKGLSYKRR